MSKDELDLNSKRVDIGTGERCQQEAPSIQGPENESLDHAGPDSVEESEANPVDGCPTPPQEDSSYSSKLKFDTDDMIIETAETLLFLSGKSVQKNTGNTFPDHQILLGRGKPENSKQIRGRSVEPNFGILKDDFVRSLCLQPKTKGTGPPPCILSINGRCTFCRMKLYLSLIIRLYSFYNIIINMLQTRAWLNAWMNLVPVCWFEFF